MIARRRKTTAVTVIAADRRARAIKMRRAGAKLADIAKELGVSVPRACVMIQESLEEINSGRLEEHNAWFEHDWAVTTELLNEYVPKALEGDYEAGSEAVKVLARRAKMRGLDAPTQLDISSESPLPTYNRDEMIRLMVEHARNAGRVIDAAPQPENGDQTNGNSEK